MSENANTHFAASAQGSPPLSLMNDTARIPVGRNHFAVIDAADIDLVGSGAWSAQVKANGVYARRKGVGRKTVYLHRLICNAPDCAIVDHIDGNPLNNMRSNLRIATMAENCRNRRRGKNNTSGAKGVHWHAGQGKWNARIVVDGKRIHLGSFDCLNAARQAYEAAVPVYHGSFGRVA